jgi:hypothetical protein
MVEGFFFFFLTPKGWHFILLGFIPDEDSSFYAYMPLWLCFWNIGFVLPFQLHILLSTEATEWGVLIGV